MQLKLNKLLAWDKRIQKLKGRWRLLRWPMMIMREMERDDILLRAESLSYLTLFSLLPVITGFFILLGLFSQWGPVQGQFETALIQILQPIPPDYREVLLDFVFEYKDGYLESLKNKSLSIALVSLGILAWVAAKVFFNIENMMNVVWDAPSPRSMPKRFRNYLISSFALPLFTAVAFILPIIVGRWGIANASVLGLFDQAVSFILLVSVLSSIYRFFPNKKITWSSAWTGAFFSSVAFMISQYGLRIYFMFGTHTAYGKAAVLPIIAFFIYVFWVILMIGAEVSFVTQNERKIN
jgi:membrane protein